jgi:citrate lyase alpha subunit
MAGPVAHAVSRGVLATPVVTTTNGGRARAWTGVESVDDFHDRVVIANDGFQATNCSGGTAAMGREQVLADRISLP